ncbi:MAG: hypothetical protein NTZ05_02610 [Chloroflexi bacterium]|nr:hypothetical protein [Chloroflexota bacterium]
MRYPVKRVVLALFCLSLVVASVGCLEIAGAINQPSSATPNETVTVALSVKASASSSGSSYNGGVALRLPNSWKVEAASYRGAYSGQLIYSQKVVDALIRNSDIPAKGGYSWWGAVSDRAYVNSTETRSEVLLSIKIGTESGTFLLDYITGTMTSGSSFFFPDSRQFDVPFQVKGSQAAPPQLGPPSLDAPLNGATLTVAWATLVWTNPAGAMQYELLLSPVNNDGPGVHIIKPTGGTVSMYTVSAYPALAVLLPDMTYTWKVRTSPSTNSIGADDGSWGAWSEVRAFRTRSVSSATITAEAPTNGSILTATAPIALRWSNAVPEVFYYELQVSPDPEFTVEPSKAIASVWWNLVHGGVTNPPNSWVTPELQPNTVYYWRVRPRVQGDGLAPAWSRTWSFRTP